MCYWVALFVGTHLPRTPRIEVSVNDKILHLGAYAGLAFLICLGTARSGIWTLRKVIIILAAASAYGVFDELTQTLVGRDCDFMDWLADTIGAGIGIACFDVFRRIWIARFG